MIWTNGLILGLGGLLVLIPVILHLLMQPKPKRVIFPALRFLQERQQTNRSRLRIRHFLLLLVRCLLIGLLVLALAGPTVASREFGNWLTLGGVGLSGLVIGLILLTAFLQAKKNWLLIGVLSTLLLGHLGLGGWSLARLLGSDGTVGLGDVQAPVAAVILIDASPRMDYRQDNSTRLEVAQELAQWLIRQFPPDSSISIATNDFDRPFFSVDLTAANRRVETLTTNFLERPLPGVLLDSLDLLSRAEQERKEIYILSDLTRQSWTGDQIRTLTRQLEGAAEISLFVIDVGIEQPQNFSLSDLELASSNLSTNGRFAIETTISRLGGPAQKVVRLKLEKPDPTRPVVRDGVALIPEEILEEQTQTFDLKENDARTLTFSGTIPLDKGTYHGVIEIDGQDGLPVDNARYFSLRVQDPWRVLVVHPSSVSPRNLVSTLSPSLEARSSNYLCDVVRQEELAEMGDLSRFQAIFLLNPAPLSDNNWERLYQYTSRGGGLAIVLGSNASRQGFPDPGFQSPLVEELLTGQLETVWDSGEEAWSLRPEDLSHPMFKMIRRYQENILWNRVPVYLHWSIDSDNRNDVLPTQVLMRFTNGQPALIERMIGQGRVLVMTTPLSERARESGRRVWNDLFNIAAVVPWLLNRMMTDYLVQPDADSLNLSVGQPASFRNDLNRFPETYQAFSPDPKSPPSRLTAADHQIKFRFTETPGHYRLRGSFDGQPSLRGFSVNLPEQATSLERLEVGELDQLLGSGRYQLARDRDQIQRQQGSARKGQEFYPILILLMLLFLGIESLMSNRFYANS
jgi:hypothetical protein